MTANGETALIEMVEFVCDAQLGKLPSEVPDRAKLLIADTVAAVIAGSSATELVAFRRGIPRTGRATVLAAELRGASEQDAAFANGLAATWLEVDEVGPWGHASAHILPTLLAAAESRERDGVALLGAFVAGYEVHARLALASKLRPTLHQSGTVGVVAAAVALAKLGGASGTDTLNRASIAAQMMSASSYRGSVSGATVRNAHPALAASAAFLTETLDHCGFTGAPQALAEVLGVTLGTAFQPESLVAGLGETWAILDAAIKLHSGCGHLHPVFDALADAIGVSPTTGRYPAVTIEALSPDMIERVDVEVVVGAEALNDPRPDNPLAAKFSIPYAAALFLSTGAAMPESFSPSPTDMTGVHDLAERVYVRSNAELVRGPRDLPARVSIRLSNGDVLRGECQAPYGWPDRPATPADVEAKFGELCRPTLGVRAEALWQTCMTLDDQPAVSLACPSPEASFR